MTVRSNSSGRPKWVRFSLAALAVGAMLAGPEALEAAPKRTKKQSAVARKKQAPKADDAPAAPAPEAQDEDPAAAAPAQADAPAAREPEPETSPEAAEAEKSKAWKVDPTRDESARRARQKPAATAAPVATDATPGPSQPDPGQATQVTTARPESMELQDRFAGSAFLLQTSANVNTFAPALQQTQNPTVGTLFMAVPRFVLNPSFAFRARLGLQVEWTNSDWTPREQEPMLTDLLFDVRYGGLPTFLNGTKATLLGTLGLPTSKASIASTLVLAPGVGVEVAHNFDRVLSGSILLVGVGSYRHSFFTEQTPGIRADQPPERQCYGNQTGCFAQLGGAGNVHDALAWTIGAFGQWGIVSPSFTFQVAHLFPYTFRDVEDLERDETRPNALVSSNVSLAVDVQLTEYLTGGIGYSMGRDLIAGDGHIGNPFFDRYQDMRLTLALSVALPGFGGSGRR